jgi:hypothetical protein
MRHISQLDDQKNAGIEGLGNEVERSVDQQHATDIMAAKIGLSSIRATNPRLQRQIAPPQRQRALTVPTLSVN